MVRVAKKRLCKWTGVPPPDVPPPVPNAALLTPSRFDSDTCLFFFIFALKILPGSNDSEEVQAFVVQPGSTPTDALASAETFGLRLRKTAEAR